ncbi:hypothetical protein R6Q59_000190 [Mikania micrantha]
MDLGEGYKSNEHKIQPHAASESADLHSKDCTTKGGCGEKGKPGGLVDMDDNHFIDAKDPNYSSSEIDLTSIPDDREVLLKRSRRVNLNSKL